MDRQLMEKVALEHEAMEIQAMAMRLAEDCEQLASLARGLNGKLSGVDPGGVTRLPIIHVD